MKSVPSDVIRRFAGMPCVLYGRVSTVVQESDGYSLHNQLRDGRDVADQIGCDIVAEDFEQGSGQDWDLAGIANMMRHAKDGTAKLMIVKNITRLSRDVGKQAYLEHHLKQAGAYIYYFDEDFDDTPTGRFARDIVGRAGQWQLEISRELSMQAKYDKVADFGRPVGNGQTPYGWKRIVDTSGKRPRTVGYEHDPHEAEVIRRFRALRHMSMLDFCEQLNAEGIPSPGKWRPSEERPLSGKWNTSSIRNILSNRMTWGEYRYGQTISVKGQNGKTRHILGPAENVRTLQLEPILTKAEVDELQAVISSRTNQRERSPGGDDDPYTLRGMLMCGHCGGKLASRSNGAAGSLYRTYRCLRSIPALAKRYRTPVCTLPAVIANTRPERSGAGGIEDLVSCWFTGGAFTEAKLREAARRSRAADSSGELHADQLAFVRTTLGAKREAHQRASKMWAEAPDDLARASFEKTMAELADDVRRLETSLERLEAYVPSGISVDEEEAIVTEVTDLLSYFADTTPAERRAIYRRLRFGAVVTADPDGAYEIGRHRYAIKWTGEFLGAALEGNPEQNIVMFCLEITSNDQSPAIRFNDRVA